MAGNNEIYLYGSVGASWWGDDYFTANTVRAALEGRDGELTVRINSGGGSAIEGQAIYTLLKDYPEKVTIVVDGVAASAASLIAMAGDEIVMRLGSWMLIHDPAQPWTEGRGTEDDHLREAEVLGVIGNAYAEIYAARSGLSRDEAREIMRVETVLNGQLAVEKGFADRTETTEAAPEAAFDYRIYAHAPQHLRDQAEKLGPVPNRKAVMAMFAGRPRVNPKKEPLMADKEQKPVEASTVVTPSAAQAVVSTEAAVAAERDRVKRISTAARIAGVGADVVTALIDEGVTVEVALDRISAAWQANGDVDKPMHGVPTARTSILRDERDTQRVGMSTAILAQIARQKGDVDGRAQPYMALSLVELAALCIGSRESLRTPADRQRVLEMAFHTTSDFPAVLENALNKRLMAQYDMQEPTYRRISAQMDFTDFRPHPVSQIGGFPLLKEVNESGEIKFGTIGDKKETVVLKSYAAGLRVSRQAMINDDLGAIDRAVRETAMAVAATEEQVFYAMAFGGSNADGPTLTETTRQVFNTTDGTKAGSNAAITVPSLSLGRAALRKRKRLDGSDLDAVASVLLVGPDKETEAQQIVAPIQAQQAGNVNPFSGLLSVVTTAKITGNAWYLLADPDRVPVFMHGFLSGDAGPRVRMEEPFGMQGAAWTVERDFGCGAVDWRGGYKNAGA
jgi:ATP-dependent protease ClpP protease subunit